MSSVTVEQIVEMINQLPPNDRELLERRLAEQAESEWRQEAEDARRQAKAQGIDQKAIDEAIRQHRHGA